MTERHRHRRNATHNDRHGPQPRRRQTTHPTPGQIADALEELASHPVPGTPSISAAKTVRRALSTPIRVDDRKVKTLVVQSGDPGHGAHRSDDHISRYEVVAVADCPECGPERAEYSYRAHHHISGQELMECKRCGHEYTAEQWG